MKRISDRPSQRDTTIGETMALFFGAIIVSIIASAVLVATVYHSQLSGYTQTYELQAEWTPSGEIVVLDHDISLIDCHNDVAERRKHWGSNVQFSCVPAEPTN